MNTNVRELRGVKAAENQALAQAERTAAQLLRRSSVAALHQIQQLQRLERCLQQVSGFGFVALGFTAYPMEAPCITIEPPEDALIDALEGRFGVCGKFARDGSTLWLSVDGIRVQWTIDREDAPGGGEPMREAA